MTKFIHTTFLYAHKKVCRPGLWVVHREGKVESFNDEDAT